MGKRAKDSAYNLKQDEHIHSLHLIPQSVQSLRGAEWEKKLKTEKEKGKLSPLAGHLILYLKHPEASARRF